MSLSFNQKKAVVDTVTDVLGSAQAGVVAEYRGLSVAQLTELRKAARNAGVWVKVVKNNLARRAVRETDFECLAERFVGPVILSVCADPVAVAKVMSDFAQHNEQLKITAGVMQGAPIDAAMIERLAKLPNRDELIAKLMGTMTAPVQNLAATLNEIPARFVRTLAAVAKARSAA